MDELEPFGDYWTPQLKKPINTELRDKVFGLRDEFAGILDNQGVVVDGLLRVKMAKAELLLNRIGNLINQQLTD